MWVANDDPLELSVESIDEKIRLIQQYSLLMLWYSMNGKGWLENTG